MDQFLRGAIAAIRIASADRGWVAAGEGAGTSVVRVTDDGGGTWRDAFRTAGGVAGQVADDAVDQPEQPGQPVRRQAAAEPQRPWSWPTVSATVLLTASAMGFGARRRYTIDDDATDSS